MFLNFFTLFAHLVLILLLRSFLSAFKVTLDSSLLFKLGAEHDQAERQKNDGYRVKGTERDAAIDVKRKNKSKDGMIYRCGEDNASKSGFTVTLRKLTYKVGTLQKSVVLGRSADHLALYSEPLALFLYVNERLALIFIKLYPIVNKLGVFYNAEKLISRGVAFKLYYLHNHTPRQE